jgi:hypothetical protein
MDNFDNFGSFHLLFDCQNYYYQTNKLVVSLDSSSLIKPGINENKFIKFSINVSFDLKLMKFESIYFILYRGVLNICIISFCD